MYNFFFNFEDFPVEILKKEKSIKLYNNQILFEALLKNVPINYNQQLKKLFFILKDLPFDRVYKNYLSHPIRLTYILKYISKKNKTGDYFFSMCHNLKEIGFLEKLKLDGFISEEVERKINILTIDRNKQLNFDYLESYYNNIHSYSNELLIFKAFDKLDNLLLANDAVLHHDNIKIIQNFLLPKIKILNTKLFKYIEGLINYLNDIKNK